ncbi:hypothetical protein HIM_10069 [Hirsutella minnesotensis 3608]|uniref:GED domain-containing protein n=1 Tax=Hirsutella minnesotensis 3608 TaxID=1043627 RepID=A0A0F7ZKF9_9HYPO|nr:hypothetical protein HIM_10069 [Hirsutella minnesotensis 3608]
MKPAAAMKAEKIDLQFPGQRDVLDIVDSLRSQGISQYVDLPQIVVCGDQSSGKSSVLEAISGMAFPTQDALCTRFATELVLRRSPSDKAQSVNVSIIAGSERSQKERDDLTAFSPDTEELNMGNIIEEAKNLMGLKGTNKVFCTDILRVEISSTNQPHLTLVDLPGLFLSGNKEQTIEDSKLVESLVLSYMEQPRSIILAVVSAKSEFALQQVTQRARERDPHGKRTLGLITKPDTLDEGSESERAYYELSQNKDVHFHLGWHVLRNRDFSTRDVSLAERDAIETTFFSKGIWASLSPMQLGVDALRKRLSQVLHNQILTHLPRVLLDIRSEVAGAKTALEKLGAARATPGEQRRYLLHVSNTFTALIKASVEGDYSNRLFFGDSSTGTGNRRRFRAQIQNTLTEFSKTMRARGHSTTIVESAEDALEDTTPKAVHRAKFLEGVSDIIRINRGRELPGTFNPLIVGELFSAQCQPWSEISKSYISQIFDSVRIVLLEAIEHVADADTASRLAAEILNPATATLEAGISDKLTELLRPHIEGHPITYNHYLTENLQKAQIARHKARIREALEGFFFSPSGQDLESVVPAQIISAITKATEPNMDNYASMAATETMEAYYKVALKNYVDDVSVLAVENCLVQRLPEIISTNAICDLDDEDVCRLAGESPETSAERVRLAEKIRVLEEGLERLKRLNRNQPICAT